MKDAFSILKTTENDQSKNGKSQYTVAENYWSKYGTNQNSYHGGNFDGTEQ